MKKTLILALVLAPLTFSFSGCASKKRMKALEAELLACRESRTKLMQERSEVEEPQEQNLTEGDEPTAPEPATTAAVATRDPEDCS